MGLSDDLGKLDGFVESVTRKVAAYLGEVLEDQRDKLHENLMANNGKCAILPNYLLLISENLSLIRFQFLITLPPYPKFYPFNPCV